MNLIAFGKKWKERRTEMKEESSRYARSEEVIKELVKTADVGRTLVFTLSEHAKALCPDSEVLVPPKKGALSWCELSDIMWELFGATHARLTWVEYLKVVRVLLYKSPAFGPARIDGDTPVVYEAGVCVEDLEDSTEC